MSDTPDKREAILARLLAIVQDIAGDESERNKRFVDEDALPAITVLEGREEADPNDPPNRPSDAPRRVYLIPQILIAAGDEPAKIGPELNRLRRRVRDAIKTDAPLIALTHDGKGGRYDGMESDLELGGQMLGQMALKFRFLIID